MDELDLRLRARLARLAAAVPVDPVPVATAPIRRVSARPNAHRFLAASAVGIVAVVVTVGALGLVGLGPGPGPLSTPTVPGTVAANTPTTSAASVDAASPSATSVSQPPTTSPSVDPLGPRFPDGIPTTYQGAPVLRGAAALAKASSTPNTTPFLVGGWLTVQYGAFSCPAQLANQPAWTSTCGAPALTDVAGTIDEKLFKAITLHLVNNGLQNPIDGLASGPVIVRVHVHDPKATECGDAFAACDRLMVAEAELWAGDEATNPRPISIVAAADAVSAVDPGANLKPDGPGVVHTSCGGTLPSAQLLEGDRQPTDMPAVTSVEVLPTTAARERALPQAEGPTGTFTKSALVCEQSSGSLGRVTGSEDRWLVVANVAVLVQLHAPVSSADRDFVARLTRALEAARAGSSG